ncbi:MAG: AAC(3) family N-acetyltransferase [Candidatus Omnitrophota bacterium]
MKINKGMVKKELKRLGLKKGDVVFVHSALSALGEVEGGPDTVIDALLETVGSKGTVAMTRLGGALLSRVFAERKETIEGIHPTHPVAARGAKAKLLIRDHIKAETACGKKTPFGRLIDWNGFILLLGVDQDRNTTLHALEEYADSPYLSERILPYKDAAGRKKTKVLKKFPGPHRDFIGLDKLFLKSGIMKVGKVGNAVARLMSAGKMARIGLAALKTNPALTLCDNPNCADCVMQRGKIKEKRLKEESFILTAVSDEVSSDLTEALTVLQGQGIKQIELRKINGKNLIAAAESECGEILGKIEGAGFKVSAINTGVNRGGIHENPEENLESFRKYLNLAEFFKTGYLLISSFLRPGKKTDECREETLKNISEMARLAGEKKIMLLIENEPKTYASGSADCAAIIETINSPYLKLAFNPANFAAAGEKPFLEIPSRILKFSRLLYVNDGLFSGAPQLPGGGNAEIKELISILRCRSFSGYLSIKPGFAGGKENFNKAADAFWRLLENM